MDAQNLDPISWIDLTSAAMLLVFLVLGFFRGFLWQMSRLVSLLLAWILANQFHVDLTSFFQNKMGLFEGTDYATYISFFVIFIGVLVLLSVLTIVLEKFVEKLHLTFYNRVGGGLLGVLQGVGLLLAAVGLIYLITPAESALAKEVGSSRTGRFARVVVKNLDGFLSDDIMVLYGLKAPVPPLPKGQEQDLAPGEGDHQDEGALPGKDEGTLPVKKDPAPGNGDQAGEGSKQDR